VLYHAATKTGVKADMARREAELEAKKKAHGTAQLKCDFQGRKLIVSLISQISRTMRNCHTVSHIHSVKVEYISLCCYYYRLSPYSRASACQLLYIGLLMLHGTNRGICYLVPSIRTYPHLYTCITRYRNDHIG
jgi:hypothetical protein